MLWVMLTILSACVCGALAWPLLRAPARPPRRAAYDLEVYRDQLAEVARDRERGVLEAGEAEAARSEIERRVLGLDLDGPISVEAAARRSSRLPRYLAILVLIALPGASVGIYLSLGQPGSPDRPLAARADLEPKAPTGAAAPTADMRTLVARLAKRMAENPDDSRGWLLLGRSYRTIGQMEDALSALREARDRAGKASETRALALTELAELLVNRDQGEVAAEARQAFLEALPTVPEDPRPAYYLGLADAQAGNLEAAHKRWRALAESAPADAPWLPSLTDQIRKAAGDLGIAFAPLARDTSPETPEPRGQPGPTREQMEAAASMSASDRTEMIRGMVAGLAERLEDDPRDLEGWLRLIRAYKVLGETDKANAALARARSAFKADGGAIERIDGAARSLGLGSGARR